MLFTKKAKKTIGIFALTCFLATPVSYTVSVSSAAAAALDNQTQFEQRHNPPGPPRGDRDKRPDVKRPAPPKGDRDKKDVKRPAPPRNDRKDKDRPAPPREAVQSVLHRLPRYGARRFRPPLFHPECLRTRQTAARRRPAFFSSYVN